MTAGPLPMDCEHGIPADRICVCGVTVESKFDHVRDKHRDECFTCYHWRRLYERAELDTEGRRVIFEGRHFVIETDLPREKWRVAGHAGAHYDIEFADGRRVTTHNLWAQGSVSEIWRDRLPDNTVALVGSYCNENRCRAAMRAAVEGW